MTTRFEIAFITLLLAGCSSSHLLDDGGIVRDADPRPDARVRDGGVTVTPRDGGRPTDDAGAPVDAGGNPRPDAGMTMTGLAGSIECGTGRCELPTDGCLASCQDGGDVFVPACVMIMPGGNFPSEPCPSGDERFPRYWLTCDGPEDCSAGESCNITFGSLGQYAYCNEFGGTRLCHDASDCPVETPVCSPTTALPGYSACTAE